jgi:PST family polysaccharide transporter
MGFLKTSLLGGISTGITMLCGLITTKYVAVIIGPAGMAYVGQFTNVTVVCTLLATAACANGIVKYIAEYKDLQSRRAVISNALILSGICLLITILVVIGFSLPLSRSVFDTATFRDVFVFYGMFLLFPTFNLIANAILNGLQEIKVMTIVNVISACLNVLAVVISAKFFGIKGVLLANLVSATVVFFIYWKLLKKRDLISPGSLFQSFDRKFIILLLGFSSMNIVSGLLAPAIQLFIRTKLLYNFDSTTAGLWQANTRLSDYYLVFINTVIGIYYLPKLSEITDSHKLKTEIRLGYLRIMPAVILITLVIWFMREIIVKIFLTEDFLNMLPLLKWQLIGDVIKIASWILGYLMVAKAMKKMFIGTEIVFSILFVILNYVMINQYGMIGTVYAFTLNYTIYLFTLVFLLRRVIF